MKYWRRWIPDFQAATVSLSMLERGAYTDLLDFYYLNNGPIPCDHEALYRACRAFGRAEQNAVDRVLLQFFTRGETGYIQARADEELAKLTEYAENQARRGRMGGLAAAAKTHKPKGNGSEPPDESPVVCQLPLRTGEDFDVREAWIAQLAPLYPQVDVAATVNEMKGWLIGNPERRKTARGIRKFVVAWLQREQEKAAHGA